ncbi:MAG: BACON domain-containing protein, partial [Planctomycetota bacterium]
PLQETDRVIYVDTAATGAGTGLSWDDAFTSLADGVAAANASETRTNVWVAAGTYGGGHQPAAGRTLYGGFAGGETALSQRDWHGNVTTIDATGLQYGVRIADGCVVDGFTIQGATAGDLGGGVYFPSRVAARVANCRIQGNQAARGGGINADSQSRPFLVNCILANNSATTSGGAIRAYRCSPVLLHCTSVGNTGGTEGGGGAFLYQSIPIFINSIFWDNTPANVDIVATPSGGGVLLSGETGSTEYSVRYSRIGHCLVGGGLAGVSYADGIVDADPQLAPGYRLSPTSPCIDAGTTAGPDDLWALPDEDIHAEPRVQQGGPDLGADELDNALPFVTVAPEALSFVGRPPASQNLTLGNPGGSALDWTATSDQPWLLLDGGMQAAGNTVSGGTTDVTVSVDTAALVYGDYEATITVDAPGAVITPVIVPVSLHVPAGAEPAIEVSTDSIAVSIPYWQSSASRQIEVWNAGPGTMEWQASSDQPWMVPSPDVGDSAGEHDTVTLQFDTLALTPGVYSANLTITSPTAQNSPRTVTVELSITPPYLGLYLDFGTATSPVEAGYGRVSPSTMYTGARGYGWAGGTIRSKDRATGSDLERDFSFHSSVTFLADVSPGTYQVTLWLGDLGVYAHDLMGVFLEGVQVDTVSAAAGEVVSRSYTVTVVDGQLTLRLVDQGGTDPNIVIAGMAVADGGADVQGPRVVTSSPAGDMTGPVDRVRFAFNESIDAGTFTLADVVSITGPSGAITPTSVAMVDDHEYEVVFPSQSDAGAYAVVIGPAIEDEVGNAMDQDGDGANGEDPEDRYTASFTVLPPPPYPGLYLDFGTAASPVASGYARVSPSTVYNATSGYGWAGGTIWNKDRETGSDLERDFNFHSSVTFLADVPPGTYQVTLWLGDLGVYAHDL